LEEDPMPTCEAAKSHSVDKTSRWSPKECPFEAWSDGRHDTEAVQVKFAQVVRIALTDLQPEMLSGSERQVTSNRVLEQLVTEAAVDAYNDHSAPSASESVNRRSMSIVVFSV
jgi:hypothetical protein